MKYISSTFLLMFLFVFTNRLFSQQKIDSYIILTEKATQQFKNKHYRESGALYKQAFDSFPSQTQLIDLYNAACSYALADLPDNAFLQLNKLITNYHYSNYNQLTNDDDFISLHTYPQWNNIIKKLQKNKYESEKYYNKSLIEQLTKIYKSDQSDRGQITELYNSNPSSPQIDKLWKIIRLKDSINVIKVRKILDHYGWLGPKTIGDTGSATLFLVIQHAKINVQKKYLPMMRQAVKNHKASPKNLALLEDRIALGEGRKQIYGTQISMNSKSNTYYLPPLADPDHVDERRARLGLTSIAEYLKKWNITWDVKDYKRQLPAIEALEKESND